MLIYNPCMIVPFKEIYILTNVVYFLMQMQ